MSSDDSKKVSDVFKESKCSDSAEIPCVEIVTEANLPTSFGNFKIVAFLNNVDKKEHVGLVKGQVKNMKNVILRIHSECLTGDVFGSLRCDCRDQLWSALEYINNQKSGVLLYMRQEGRGIGLINKIKAYVLQEQGYDTSDANIALGFKEDMRDYSLAAEMIKLLEIKSVNLLTNNPQKIEDLKKHGIKINKRVPIEIKPNKYNELYLKTKKEKLGHIFHQSES